MLIKITNLKLFYSNIMYKKHINRNAEMLTDQM